MHKYFKDQLEINNVGKLFYVVEEMGQSKVYEIRASDITKIEQGLKLEKHVGTVPCFSK